MPALASMRGQMQAAQQVASPGFKDTEGLEEHAPRPRVSSAPIWILFSACELSNACASVLAAQNSTPWW